MNSEIENYISLKSEQSALLVDYWDFDTEASPMITTSEIIEYTYCPRFIYFMNCLGIPQREELRVKVLKGREIHETREKSNVDYVRKRINCIRKEVSVYIASKTLKVRGIVDEVLFFSDGTAGPLDYKFTKYTDFTFKTHKIQSTIYALLIQENYNIPVQRGYLCYVRSNNAIKEIQYKEEDFKNAKKIVAEIFDILFLGYFPRKTKYQSRCLDCTYRNICNKM